MCGSDVLKVFNDKSVINNTHTLNNHINKIYVKVILI
jgi:hypothetical protein